MTMEDILVDWIFPLFLILCLALMLAAPIFLLIYIIYIGHDLLKDDD